MCNKLNFVKNGGGNVTLKGYSDTLDTDMA